MPIETTINIHKSIYTQIESSAEISGFSIHEIIIHLLKMAVKEYPQLYFYGTRRIRYQDRDEEKQWIPKHITYSEIEYDYVQDMKKLFKMSISHILAYMVRHFLKKVIYEMMSNKNSKNSDNYRLTGYAVIHKMVNNTVCWKIFWGIPQPPDLLFT